MPVVRLADGFVERLVVDAIDPAAADAAVRDRRRMAAVHQTGDELSAVMPPAGDPRERAVLALKKTARVRHDGDQEAGLALGEAERAQRVHAHGPRAVVDGAPMLVGHHKNSSARRGCGVDRPPPPVWTL